MLMAAASRDVYRMLCACTGAHMPADEEDIASATTPTDKSKPMSDRATDQLLEGTTGKALVALGLSHAAVSVSHNTAFGCQCAGSCSRATGPVPGCLCGCPSCAAARQSLCSGKGKCSPYSPCSCPSRATCDYCGRTFANKRKLWTHRQEHTLLFACAGDCGFPCDKEFPTAELLRAHVNSFLGVKPYVCDTEGCGKAYVDAQSLRRHKTQERELRDKIIFQCNVCSVICKGSRNLNKHKRKAHAQEKPAVETEEDRTCHACQRVFETKHGMLCHKGKEHKK
jgi:hypothetical protein